MADFFNEIGHLFLFQKHYQKPSCNFIKFISMFRFLAYQMVRDFATVR